MLTAALFLLALPFASSFLIEQEKEAINSLIDTFQIRKWDKSRDFCGQVGILCSGQMQSHDDKREREAEEREQHIEMLSLSSLSLSGSFPSQLFLLESLTSLDLSANSFSGNLPSEILNWEDLVYLDLSRNKFSGEINEDLFKQLRLLKHLDLSNNEFTSIPDHYGSRYATKGMDYLDFSHNKISGTIPKHLSDFDDLTVLRLNDNQFYGTIPESIGNLEELIALDLSNNQLSGKIPDMRFSQFQLLFLGGSNLFCPIGDFSSAASNDFSSFSSQVDTCQPCNQNSCQNQGECSQRSEDEFKCACLPGFKGEFCQERKEDDQGGQANGAARNRKVGICSLLLLVVVLAFIF